MQRVAEKRGVCVRNADVGPVDRSKPERQNIQLLLKHGDVPHTRWCQQQCGLIAEGFYACNQGGAGLGARVGAADVATELAEVVICS